MEQKVNHRLLILSHKSPYAPVDGGVLAIRHFFEALVQDAHFEVFMICLSTQKHPHGNVPEAFQKQIKTIDIDTSLSKRKAFSQLIKNKSYNLSRFYKHAISQEIQSHLDEQPDYDFILFESLFSTVYFDDLKTNDYGMHATAEDVGIFLRALNDGTLFEEGEQEIYSSIYQFEHAGWVPGYQSFAKYYKDIDAVNISFYNTTDPKLYNWNLSEIINKRIYKIIKKSKNEY